MEVGDLVVTPPQAWHDHGHDGVAPMMWMDILDHPTAVPLDVSYVILGSSRMHSAMPQILQTPSIGARASFRTARQGRSNPATR